MQKVPLICNSQQPTANSQQPTANSPQPTAQETREQYGTIIVIDGVMFAFNRFQQALLTLFEFGNDFVRRSANIEFNAQQIFN